MPLAVEFARSGATVVGIDVDPAKASAINAGRSYVLDVPGEAVAAVVQAGMLKATTDYAVLETTDAACICVPTPLRKSQDPDISYIVSAVDAIRPWLHRGMLICLLYTSPSPRDRTRSRMPSSA